MNRVCRCLRRRRPTSAAAPANPQDQAGVAVPLTKADVDIWLDGFMPYALRTADIPGAVVTVVKDGQILTARGFGYADVEKRTPVDPDRTLFRPGSVSKLITWTAAMQLVEQGKLDLDKDINTYLDFKIPDYDGKPITLRQIMTHTAGFEEAIKDLIFSDPAHMLPLGDYLKRWTPKRVFAPGTTPAYSNWATALTGYMVERVSGESFDDYCDKHIFAPLGMTNSTMRQPLPEALASQMASGYKPGQDAGKFEIVGPAPAGSLSSTGTDMAKFMIANLDQGKGLLSPETAAMMHDSPLDKVDPASLLPPLNRMELGYLRDQHQWPRSDRAPGRHRVLPHLAASPDEGRRRRLLLVQQRRKGGAASRHCVGRCSRTSPTAISPRPLLPLRPSTRKQPPNTPR